MYWALAEMQRPFIDLYPATRYELSWGQKIFPVLLDPENAGTLAGGMGPAACQQPAGHAAGGWRRQ